MHALDAELETQAGISTAQTRLWGKGTGGLVPRYLRFRKMTTVC